MFSWCEWGREQTAPENSKYMAWLELEPRQSSKTEIIHEINVLSIWRGSLIGVMPLNFTLSCY